MAVRIISPSVFLSVKTDLPASKSVSNRLLIIQSLCEDAFVLKNVSIADDTTILSDLINSNESIEDAGEGGTTFRFLLALRCLQGKSGILCGSKRLSERPVLTLVEALNSLGAGIEYIEKHGFPPLKLSGGKLQGNELKIDAGISSQFISALMLIAPYLPKGLRIVLEGEMVSSSYIKMTAVLMHQFGVDVQMERNEIVISNGKYTSKDVFIYSDWSAAAFFYAMAALKPNSTMSLLNLKEDDLQGDQVLVSLMHEWGVKSQFEIDEVCIQGIGIPEKKFIYDFTETPDLAQAFAVMAALSHRKLFISGLSTLKNKETDRLLALKIELEKLGAIIHITNNSLEVLQGINLTYLENKVLNTYNDHRMVMALSLFCLSGFPVILDDISSVSKSFPNYFLELKKLGFVFSEL